jgi:Heme NO binding associated
MEKTKLMEESMKQLDVEMRRSDELLAQMIPKQATILKNITAPLSVGPIDI